MDRVHLSDQSKRDLKKISFNEVKKIERQLLRLEKEPFSGKKLTGKLSGFYSLKAWPYRIIYFIKEKQKEVWIISILHRQGAYK